MIINILDLLENSAEKYPNKISFADDKSSITFSELVRKAKIIGTKIINDTEGQIRRPIIVFVDRSIESIISFFGVVYSGNFYVPIDSESPLNRNEIIFKTLNPLASIENKVAYLDTVIEKEPSFLRYFYNDFSKESYNENQLNKVRSRIIDIDPVYSIFTSGSTGVPKGVLISHKSVIDLSAWLEETFDFSAKDNLGNQTPFYFDGSVKDIYITLRTGATTYIIAKKYFTFTKLLIQFLNEKKITSILWATSAIILVGNSGILEELKLEFVNKVFFAGEAMPAKQLNNWKKHLPEAKYINLYGPTEVTVDTTYFIVERDFNDDEYIPIGKPCKNKEVLILNDENKLVERDEEGELCARGTGVALGYYNNESKTNDVFVQNPFNNFYKDIIYRTGDIVKYNERGEIVFVSRKDFQIKHMGSRIELGEIEVVINSLEKVYNAACIYDSENNKIIAFYSTSDGYPLNLINLLKSKLPKYMIPNIVLHYGKELPLNPNGKIDRLKLKEIYLNGKIN